MDQDPFQYDTWIEEALKSVIRRSLNYAAENGLPGEHHFFLSYRTDVEGVEMPGYLKAEHPEEMSIVLQHQFDELIVNEDAVWVTLKFRGKPERLRIPFAAMVSFADPSVNFGLQLKMSSEPEDGMELGALSARNFDTDTTDDDADDRAAPAVGHATGEVIALDAFRKK
ncbi:MAG: ClpXP protease specificity-enhancing factor SspB [Proteobacteria bacterium]|nr:ClpXP protease specificity-enhancing factor SspB [Pseudomonadota bacterium]